MGEEEKKAEEPKNTESEKKEETDKKQNEAEVVLKVFMHCEGCARKVRRCLRGLDGVEDVITDCKSSKVVVKGEKAAADPMKVLERVQRKSHRQVELVSPIPKPESKQKEEKQKPEEKDKEDEKEEEEEEAKVIVVVLKVHMHCEACAEEIKKRILRMKGVESAEPDLKRSEVAVKGVFEPAKLVQYVHKRTGKHAAIVIKQEPKPEKKEEGGSEEKPKGEAEAKEGGDEKPKEEEQSKDKEGEAKTEEGEAKTEEGKEEEETEESKLVELKRSELQYYPPRYGMELYANAYPPPPQMFSDENPNACSVM